MEASLLAVAPAPKPPQGTAPQANQATDEATPFTAFLTAAQTANEENGEETEGMDSESSAFTPSQQEMLLAAELTALSFQDSSLNISQPGSGQEIAAAFSNITGVLPGQELAATFSSITGALPGQELTTTFTNSMNAEISVIPATSGLNQFQAMPASNQRIATDLAPVTTEEQLATSLNKSVPLLTQQLQAILTGNSQDTITIHAPYQSTSTETLNALSSPYIQAVDSAPNASLSAAQTAMITETADRTGSPDTLEGLRQNVDEHYLNAKLEAHADKNNAGSQQQGTGQQENANTFTASLNSTEQTGQFSLTNVGQQTPVSAPGNTPVASPATLPPGVPVPAGEIINHLVDRFSINPRLQTSKISLNLNPAELGALKIDILVKGDSIKAHIAVNNQQIQETIEKHMPRLRAILEQQGFTIDDFQVTQESTDFDSNNFFQQQFSSKQESTPQRTLAGSEAAFDHSLNTAEEILSTTSMDSGINLSI